MDIIPLNIQQAYAAKLLGYVSTYYLDLTYLEFYVYHIQIKMKISWFIAIIHIIHSLLVHTPT